MSFDVAVSAQHVHDWSKDGPLSGDLIWGVKSISTEIARTQRQTFHLLEKKSIPARKVGGRWVASRSALRNHFAGTV